MLRTLAPGDLVLIAPPPSGEGSLPAKGSVVAVVHPQKPNTLLIKRVASHGAASFSVRSDNPFEGTDSRHFGSLRRELWVGTARMRITPQLRVRPLP